MSEGISMATCREISHLLLLVTFTESVVDYEKNMCKEKLIKLFCNSPFCILPVSQTENIRGIFVAVNKQNVNNAPLLPQC